MSDLISRQAILKHIEKIRQSVQMMDDTRRASVTMNGMYLCEKAVKNQPSAQPEQNGKWIYNSPTTMKCNRCGFVIKDWDWHRFKFCPNCGADMRGGE